MPNAEGRTATRRAPAKRAAPAATPPAAAPAAGEEEKPERYVRSPLERAEAALAKADEALKKAKGKLETFETTKAALETDVEDAQVEYDYANMHPALVKKRKEEAEQGDDVAPEQGGTEGVEDDVAAEDDDVEGEQGGTEDVDAAASGAPADPFEADLPAVPAPAEAPFDFGQQPNVTRV